MPKSETQNVGEDKNDTPIPENLGERSAYIMFVKIYTEIKAERAAEVAEEVERDKE